MSEFNLLTTIRLSANLNHFGVGDGQIKRAVICINFLRSFRSILPGTEKNLLWFSAISCFCLFFGTFQKKVPSSLVLTEHCRTFYVYAFGILIGLSARCCSTTACLVRVLEMKDPKVISRENLSLRNIFRVPKT